MTIADRIELERQALVDPVARICLQEGDATLDLETTAGDSAATESAASEFRMDGFGFRCDFDLDDTANY